MSKSFSGKTDVMDAVFSSLNTISANFEGSVMRASLSGATQQYFEGMIPEDAYITQDGIDRLIKMVRHEMGAMPPGEHPFDWKEPDGAFSTNRRAEVTIVKGLYTELAKTGEDKSIIPLEQTEKETIYIIGYKWLANFGGNPTYEACKTAHLSNDGKKLVFDAIGLHNSAALYPQIIEGKIVTLPVTEPIASEEKSSNTLPLIALFAGAVTTIAGLFNLKKKESAEPIKEGEEKPKPAFNTAGVIATAVGALAAGWAVYSLVTRGKSNAVLK